MEEQEFEARIPKQSPRAAAMSEVDQSLRGLIKEYPELFQPGTEGYKLIGQLAVRALSTDLAGTVAVNGKNDADRTFTGPRLADVRFTMPESAIKMRDAMQVKIEKHRWREIEDNALSDHQRRAWMWGDDVVSFTAEKDPGLPEPWMAEHEDAGSFYPGTFSASQMSEFADKLLEVRMGNLIAWAVARWQTEVKNRPIPNVHRRSLDDTWRQVITALGGDPQVLLGDDHDTLHARYTGFKENPARKPIDTFDASTGLPSFR